jgi:hypothetical protein
MDFREVYKNFCDDIKVTALSQHVPGMAYDDVVSEMTACLWKAWRSHDPSKGSFGSYWWSLWLNRKADIYNAFRRQKRPTTVPLPPELLPDEALLTQIVPLPPKGSSHAAKLVWHMLATGERASDVIEKTGLTRRRYYELIASWRTKEVEDSLRA